MQSSKKQTKSKRASTKGGRVSSNANSSPPRRPRTALAANTSTEVVYRNPRVSSRGKTITISHTEHFHSFTYVAGTGWDVHSFNCQPADPLSFPWLAGIAGHYESYKFRSLEYNFKSRSATSTLGIFGMAFDFDPLDAPPPDEFVALSYADQVSGSCWTDHRLRVDLSSDRLPARHTRQSSLPGTDLKTYDLGRIHFFGNSVSVVTSPIGMISVTYVIDLFTPQLESNGEGSFASTAAGLAIDDIFSGLTAETPASHLPATIGTQGVYSTLDFAAPFEGVINYICRGHNLTSPPVLQLVDSDKGSMELMHSVMGDNQGLDIYDSSAMYKLLLGPGARILGSLTGGAAPTLTNTWMELIRGPRYDVYT